MSEHILNRTDTDYVSYEYIKGDRALTILYLHGLLSSKKSLKAENVKSYCVENGYPYLALDYTSHGDSSGVPSDFRISQCMQDTLDVIHHVSPDAPLLIVGNSLGGWISFLVAEKLPNQVKGVLSLAPGLDFTEDVWNYRFDDKVRTALKAGIVFGPSEETGGYCFSYPMFQDAQAHLLLTRTINYAGPVEIIWGDKDEFVPMKNVLALKDKLDATDVRLHVLKNVGHRLIDTEILAFSRATLCDLIERIQL